MKRLIAILFIIWAALILLIPALISLLIKLLVVGLFLGILYAAWVLITSNDKS